MCICVCFIGKSISLFFHLKVVDTELLYISSFSINHTHKEIMKLTKAYVSESLYNLLD